MVSYLQQGVAVIILYLFFAGWSATFYFCVRRAVIRVDDKATLIAGSAIVGPVLLGLALWLSMWVSPFRAPEFYIGILSIPAGGLIFCVIKAFRCNVRFREKLKVQNRPRVFLIALIGVFSIGTVCVLAAQLFFLPIHANDPLEYMQLGRAFFESRAAEIYPIRSSDSDYGFLAPWTHPPVYGFLITFAYFLQGSSEIAGAAKFIGLWFGCSTAMLCGALIYSYEKRPSLRSLVAPLFIITVPIFFQLIQSAHIDAMRIATFTAAFSFMHLAVRHEETRWFFVASIAAGSAVVSHSIGILTPFLVGPLILVLGWREVRTVCARVGLFAIGVMVIGSPHYLRNVHIFGGPIQDSIPVWEIPDLGVARFLEVSRGLDTLVDRFFHGVFMPVTRPEYFGWVPALALSAALFYVLYLFICARRRDGEESQHEPIAACLPAQLVVVNFIFFALLFVSVVLGSELAIKNARYLLTTTPLLVVLFFVLLGKAGRQSSLWSAFRFADGASLNAVTASPVRRVLTSDDSGYKRHSSLVNWSIGVAVFGLGLSQVVTSAQASFGNVSLYLTLDGEFLTRLFLDERAKRDASSLGDAYVERAARRLVSGDDEVLVFRQASFGFYRAGKFKSHVDSALVDLFVEKDRKALANSLLRRGIRWLYLPNYPLPEVENSAFGQLVRDPAFVRPVAVMSGWGLFEISAGIFEPKVFPLSDGDDPARLFVRSFAQGELGGPAFIPPSAKVSLQDGEFVEITRERGLVRRLSAWDAYAAQPMALGLNPVEIGAVDFTIDNHSRVLLTAILSGSGLVELAVEYNYHEPERLFWRDGFVDHAFAQQGLRSERVVREIIWSGVLTDEPREVGGWFMPALNAAEKGGVSGARLVFRVRNGDTLRIHRWLANSIAYADDFPDNKATDAALASGWQFFGTTLAGRLENEFRALAVSRSSSGEPGVVASGVDGLSYLALSPRFQLSSASSEMVVEPQTARRLDQLINRGDFLAEISTKLVGRGALKTAILFLCNEEEFRKFSSFSLQSFIFGEDDTREIVRHVQLPRIYLFDDHTIEKTWVVEMPCVPRIARVGFSRDATLKRSREEQSRGPPVSDYVEVQDLNIRLRSRESYEPVRLLAVDKSLVGAP
jgi:hypothetical protein